MPVDAQTTRHLQTLVEVDDRLRSIWFEKSRVRGLPARASQTRAIKNVLRDVGQSQGYSVRESNNKHDLQLRREVKELLWDIVWLSVDASGDILDFPLACEIELTPTQQAVEEEVRKLLLANAAVKVLICSTVAFFDIFDLLKKCSMVRPGDLWYAAHFGPSRHFRYVRHDYTLDWDSIAYRYPYQSYGRLRDAVKTLVSPQDHGGKGPGRAGWTK